MKRFFGMMPCDEIAIEKTYKAHGIMTDVDITIQAGPEGWSVIWPDKGVNYNDETNDPEDNFKIAYELAIQKYPDMVEKDESAKEYCCENCDECEESEESEDESEDISGLLSSYTKLAENIMERISRDWSHIIDHMLNRFQSENAYVEYIKNPENTMPMIDRFVYESRKFRKLQRVKSLVLDPAFGSHILNAFKENWNSLTTVNDAKVMCSDMQECINMYDLLNAHGGDAIKMCLHDDVSAPLLIISNVIMYAYDEVTSELEYQAIFSAEITLGMDLGSYSFFGPAASWDSNDDSKMTYTKRKNILNGQVRQYLCDKIIPSLNSKFNTTAIIRNIAIRAGYESIKNDNK